MGCHMYLAWFISNFYRKSALLLKYPPKIKVLPVAGLRVVLGEEGGLVLLLYWCYVPGASDVGENTNISASKCSCFWCALKIESDAWLVFETGSWGGERYLFYTLVWPEMIALHLF